jgi:hypothetical protein
MRSKLSNVTQARRKSLGCRVPNPSGGNPEPFAGSSSRLRISDPWDVGVGEEVVYGWTRNRPISWLFLAQPTLPFRVEIMLWLLGLMDR